MSQKKKYSSQEIEKRRKQVEGTATFALILICVALISPFTNPGNLYLLSIFRWIFGAGALLYIIARLADITDLQDSLRLRRLRRLEFWAGISFGIATFFWFYNQHHLGEYAGMLAIMRTTILFTLVGAIIQIIASWLIYTLTKKEIRERDDNSRSN